MQGFSEVAESLKTISEELDPHERITESGFGEGAEEYDVEDYGEDNELDVGTLELKDPRNYDPFMVPLGNEHMRRISSEEFAVRTPSIMGKSKAYFRAGEVKETTPVGKLLLDAFDKLIALLGDPNDHYAHGLISVLKGEW